MLKFSNILLVIFLLSTSVGACMFANSGEEFDELITLEKLENKNHYRVSVPRNIGSSAGWPTLTLVYSSNEVEEGCEEEVLADGTRLSCFPKAVIREELKLGGFWDRVVDWFSNNNVYKGEFYIKEIEHYSVELSVMWETEVCLTFGRKTLPLTGNSREQG